MKSTGCVNDPDFWLCTVPVRNASFIKLASMVSTEDVEFW